MAERVKLVSPFGDTAPDYAEVKIRNQVKNFDTELTFSDTYHSYQSEHVAIREAKCLKTLFSSIFTGIRQGDQFAGRTEYRQVGFGLEQASGGPGFYCHADSLREEIRNADIDCDTREALEKMIEFWKVEATIDGKLMAILPDDVKLATSNDIAGMGGRLAGALLDFPKLIRLGLPGLRNEVEHAQLRAIENKGEVDLYRGMLMALDLLYDICRNYAASARDLVASTSDTFWKDELKKIATTLDNILTRQPVTLREGIQLLWLYALISGVVNYGRMDVALGDLYVNDIETGNLTEDQALSLLQALWQMIADRKIFFNGRIIVGGKGRPNETNADRFALAAIEATHTVVETEPQLTLRFSKGQNPALMKKALDVLGEGRTYPMLYNDDVNVPAVQNAFEISEELAQKYIPYGCGEYALDHTSFGSPNCAFNLLKALEATLHNGKDPLTGNSLGIPTGDINDFQSFEALFDAYHRQVEHHAYHLARRHRLEYEAETSSAAFLFVSMLYDDCLKVGKSVVGGGAHYRGGIVESFGLVNVADSLYAIKKLVFDEKRLTLAELVTILDADYVGYEEQHRWLLNAPKYGNDQNTVDVIAQKVSNAASRAVRKQAKVVGLDYFLMVNINNFFNVALGQVTAASADGRRSGSPLANGSTPTAGMDRKGITALLNSIVKLDPSTHAGYVHNMKFSKQMFGTDRPKLEALLDTYFDKGGTQAMLTVVSKGDLENAMHHPEQYRNLIVRVGGFSARFVELASEVQLDLIKRTLY